MAKSNAEWLFDLFDEEPMISKIQRIPRHIGVIPDEAVGRLKRHGQQKDTVRIIPVSNSTSCAWSWGSRALYSFTVDNTKRPTVQKKAFQKACVDAVKDFKP